MILLYLKSCKLLFGHQSGEKYFLVDLLTQRVPQLLRAFVPVGAQLLVLVRQNLHESVPGIRQVQQVLNRSLRANFVAAELPEHLLLVVVRFNAPAQFVDLKRVKCHLVQHLSLAVLRRTATAVCRRRAG